MPYFRYRIDARRLNLDLQQNVWDFIRHNTDIHTADISRPGLFEAYSPNPNYRYCQIKFL